MLDSSLHFSDLPGKCLFSLPLLQTLRKAGGKITIFLSTFQVSVSLQQSETTQSSQALRRPKVLFNMSDRFSDVLTIDYLLLTSQTFAKQQNSKYKVSKEPQSPLSSKPSYLRAQDKDSVQRDIQSDQPYRPFSFQQFDRVSPETTESNPLTERSKLKQQRDRLVNKPIKRIRKQMKKIYTQFQFPMSPCRYKSCHENLSVWSEWIYIFICLSREEYERRKYIQVHNKFQSVRLTTDKSGNLVSMKREINKFCKYRDVRQSSLNTFHTNHNICTNIDFKSPQSYCGLSRKQVFHRGV